MASVRSHERVTEALLGRTAVVPFPPGLRARDEPAVLRFLELERVALEEALSTFEDSYEIRIHARLPRGREGSGRAGVSRARRRLDALLGRLRRLALSARRVAAGEDRLSFAFLVRREGWISFVEQATAAEPGDVPLEVDATGPWPPYDFVRLVPEERPG